MLSLRNDFLAISICCHLSSALRAYVFALFCCVAPAAWALSIEQMTTNSRTNPLGIADDEISFAWADVAETRGMTQSAYQIRVGTKDAGDDVWNSGRVTSDRQVDIALPADHHLAPATRYYWQVKIWD